MTHWGRVVRTKGFKNLPQGSLVELCEEIDGEGRVVSGEELERVGGLGGTTYGVGGAGRKRKGSVQPSLADDEENEEGDDGMDVS
jgi:hypothetical protein